jgi:hypothetical protein
MISRSVLSRFIWWVILVFGLAVGAVLILLGYYLFGAIIGGFAVLRLIYTLSLPNRRGPSWRPPVSDSERALLRTMARDEFIVAAGVIGISGAQLRQDFNGGLSIAEMAGGAGVALDPILDAIVSDASARIDYAVAQGSVAKTEGDSVKSRLRPWAERLISVHKRDLPRGWRQMQRPSTLSGTSRDHGP